MKLTDADQQKLTDAIGRAEAKTSAEIVLLVQACSGHYRDVHALMAGIGALLGLAFVLFSDWEFDGIHVIPMALACGTVGWVLSALVVPRFLFKRRAAQQVEEAAHAQFSRLGVHRTAQRVGTLIYISHAEMAGRILVDSGVAREIPADVRDAWRACLSTLRDADALVALLDDMGERLGHALPRGADDENELPDHVAA